MRIEAYSQISQLYNKEVTKSVKSTVKQNNNDKLEISQTGRDYQVAKSAVAAGSDVREDLVAEYKRKINSGEYNVTASDFADKLIAKFNNRGI